MKSKFDSVWVGLIIGIVFPFITCYIFYKYNFKTLNLSEFFHQIIRLHKITQLLSLSLAGNIAVFFLFSWKNFLYSMRGVLIATFLYAAVVVLLKFVIL